MANEVTKTRKRAPNKVTPQQRAFAKEYYRTGNSLSAYKIAGYTWADKNGKPLKYLKQQCYRVSRLPAVQSELKRLEDRDTAGTRYTVEYVREEHVRLAALAEAQGDLSTATKNIEMIGKMCGAYANNLNISVNEQRVMSDAERIEAKRLAQHMLTTEVIDVKPLTPQGGGGHE